MGCATEQWMKQGPSIVFICNPLSAETHCTSLLAHIAMCDLQRHQPCLSTLHLFGIFLLAISENLVCMELQRHVTEVVGWTASWLPLEESHSKCQDSSIYLSQSIRSGLDSYMKTCPFLYRQRNLTAAFRTDQKPRLFVDIWTKQKYHLGFKMPRVNCR